MTPFSNLVSIQQVTNVFSLNFSLRVYNTIILLNTIKHSMRIVLVVYVYLSVKARNLLDFNEEIHQWKEGFL